MPDIDFDALQLDPERLPRHVALIMDGNGRWAKQRGMPRLFGHAHGAETTRDLARFGRELGIEHMTFYAFSTENWARPRDEVDGLLHLIAEKLLTFLDEFHELQTRFKHLGSREHLPDFLLEIVDRLEAETRHYPRFQLNLALNYGSRLELVTAARRIAEEVKAGTLQPEEIDEQCFADHLYTAGIPDPDLLVRTSGELRLSNYLLWQLAYSEIYVTPIYWPDFSREEFCKALRAYQARERRFGGV